MVKFKKSTARAMFVMRKAPMITMVTWRGQVHQDIESHVLYIMNDLIMVMEEMQGSDCRK